jgi:hypothetical protein
MLPVYSVCICNCCYRVFFCYNKKTAAWPGYFNDCNVNQCWQFLFSHQVFLTAGNGMGLRGFGCFSATPYLWYAALSVNEKN